ncbi:MAG TPA: glucose-1-phosphate adenylyltransferase [Anaerolineales bacterium]|nr:glucose-1-phosphate adenylyltransferase [Anaerolineales bacterium]
MATHDRVLAVILGGGRGTRLWPLTKERAKPAVPIAGKYRLIDIPLSNCLNSGVDQVAILTQFNSVSLIRHISQTYHFDLFHPGWVQILAAEQTTTNLDWYQGTADAVRKQLFEIEVTGADDVLILAGDHLYRMDYSAMIGFHRQVEADVTVAVRPIAAADAARFGVLRLSGDRRITAFAEKPRERGQLKQLVSREDPEQPYFGSMGIYIFRRRALTELLGNPHDDFGGDVIPAAIASHRVFGFTFDGYWEDIGSIRAFYEANLALVQPDPPFSFHDPVAPIYTRPRLLPGSRIYDVRLDRVLLADGCFVEGAEIVNTVVGIRSLIGDGVHIQDTIMMGADYYETEASLPVSSGTPIGVGTGSTIRGAILDKNTRIGKNVRIEPFPRGTEIDGEDWSVRDGIVVVPKNAVLPDGVRIGPE